MELKIYYSESMRNYICINDNDISCSECCNNIEDNFLIYVNEYTYRTRTKNILCKIVLRNINQEGLYRSLK